MSRTLCCERFIRGLLVAIRDCEDKILLALVARNKMELLFVAWLTFRICRIGVVGDLFNSLSGTNNALLSDVSPCALGIPGLASFRVVFSMSTLAKTLKSRT